jgi:hypothetical protein
LSAPKGTMRGGTIRCSSCGNDIFPHEIYYTLCIHMETRDSMTEAISVLEITRIAFQCRLCQEKGIGVC